MLQSYVFPNTFFGRNTPSYNISESMPGDKQSLHCVTSCAISGYEQILSKFPPLRQLALAALWTTILPRVRKPGVFWLELLN